MSEQERLFEIQNSAFHIVHEIFMATMVCNMGCKTLPQLSGHDFKRFDLASLSVPICGA